MTTSRFSRLAFVGVLSVLSATSASAMSCAIDANGKTTCPTSEQVEDSYRTWQPVACTLDAKQCPDGSYVGRVAPDCAFAACPGAASCAPYVCMDGTTHPSCAEDGTVINYFAAPCLTHGGDAGPFKDVPADHPNAQAIAYMKANRVVEGYADGTFKPDATINRAEFAKIMATSLFREEEIDSCMTNIVVLFSDTPNNSWFTPYVCKLFRLGVVNGYENMSYIPSRLINFVEAAKIISLAFDIAAPGIAANDPWYAPYVRDLERLNAIPLSIVSFDQKITRGEMAEIIWRLKAGVKDLPSQTFDSLSALVDPAKQDGSSDSSCADAFRTTGMCPQDRCVMDCADRDNPPKDGLGCPPGCFEK